MEEGGEGSGALVTWWQGVLTYLHPGLLWYWIIGPHSWMYRIYRNIKSGFDPRFRRRRRLLSWMGQASGRDVTDLASVWQDGTILCDVIHHSCPSACPGHEESQVQDTFRHAQALAYRCLLLQPAFTEAELCRMELTPNIEKRLFRYLQSLRQAISKKQLNRSVEEESEGEAHIAEEYIARGMGLIMASRNQRAIFYVYSRDGSSLMDIHIEIRGPGDDFGSILVTECESYDNPSGSSIAVEYRLTEEYLRVSYQPRSVGHHELSISRHGYNVPGSPFLVSVDEISEKTPKKRFNSIEWFTEDEERRQKELQEKKQKAKVKYRIVDFVTEKMYLTDDGKLLNVPSNEGSSSSEVPQPPDFPAPIPPLTPEIPLLTPPSPISSTNSRSPCKKSRTLSPRPRRKRAEKTKWTNIKQEHMKYIIVKPQKAEIKRVSDAAAQVTLEFQPSIFQERCKRIVTVCDYLLKHCPHQTSLEIISGAGNILQSLPFEKDLDQNNTNKRCLTVSETESDDVFVPVTCSTPTTVRTITYPKRCRSVSLSHVNDETNEKVQKENKKCINDTDVVTRRESDSSIAHVASEARKAFRVEGNTKSRVGRTSFSSIHQVSDSKSQSKSTVDEGSYDLLTVGDNHIVHSSEVSTDHEPILSEIRLVNHKQFDNEKYSLDLEEKNKKTNINFEEQPNDQNSPSDARNNASCKGSNLTIKNLNLFNNIDQKDYHSEEEILSKGMSGKLLPKLNHVGKIISQFETNSSLEKERKHLPPVFPTESSIKSEKFEPVNSFDPNILKTSEGDRNTTCNKARDSLDDDNKLQIEYLKSIGASISTIRDRIKLFEKGRSKQFQSNATPDRGAETNSFISPNIVNVFDQHNTTLDNHAGDVFRAEPAMVVSKHYAELKEIRVTSEPVVDGIIFDFQPKQIPRKLHSEQSLVDTIEVQGQTCENEYKLDIWDPGIIQNSHCQERSVLTPSIIGGYNCITNLDQLHTPTESQNECVRISDFKDKAKETQESKIDSEAKILKHINTESKQTDAQEFTFDHIRNKVNFPSEILNSTIVSSNMPVFIRVDSHSTEIEPGNLNSIDNDSGNEDIVKVTGKIFYDYPKYGTNVTQEQEEIILKEPAYDVTSEILSSIPKNNPLILIGCENVNQLARNHDESEEYKGKLFENPSRQKCRDSDDVSVGKEELTDKCVIENVRTVPEKEIKEDFNNIKELSHKEKEDLVNKINYTETPCKIFEQSTTNNSEQIATTTVAKKSNSKDTSTILENHSKKYNYPISGLTQRMVQVFEDIYENSPVNYVNENTKCDLTPAENFADPIIKQVSTRLKKPSTFYNDMPILMDKTNKIEVKGLTKKLVELFENSYEQVTTDHQTILPQLIPEIQENNPISEKETFGNRDALETNLTDNPITSPFSGLTKSVIQVFDDFSDKLPLINTPGSTNLNHSEIRYSPKASRLESSNIYEDGDVKRLSYELGLQSKEDLKDKNSTKGEEKEFSIDNEVEQSFVTVGDKSITNVNHDSKYAQGLTVLNDYGTCIQTTSENQYVCDERSGFTVTLMPGDKCIVLEECKVCKRSDTNMQADPDQNIAELVCMKVKGIEGSTIQKNEVQSVCDPGDTVSNSLREKYEIHKDVLRLYCKNVTEKYTNQKAATSKQDEIILHSSNKQFLTNKTGNEITTLFSNEITNQGSQHNEVESSNSPEDEVSTEDTVNDIGLQHLSVKPNCMHVSLKQGETTIRAVKDSIDCNQTDNSLQNYSKTITKQAKAGQVSFEQHEPIIVDSVGGNIVCELTVNEIKATSDRASSVTVEQSDTIVSVVKESIDSEEIDDGLENLSEQANAAPVPLEQGETIIVEAAKENIVPKQHFIGIQTPSDQINTVPVFVEHCEQIVSAVKESICCHQYDDGLHNVSVQANGALLSLEEGGTVLVAVDERIFSKENDDGIRNAFDQFNTVPVSLEQDDTFFLNELREYNVCEQTINEKQVTSGQRNTATISLEQGDTIVSDVKLSFVNDQTDEFIYSDLAKPSTVSPEQDDKITFDILKENVTCKKTTNIKITTSDKANTETVYLERGTTIVNDVKECIFCHQTDDGLYNVSVQANAAPLSIEEDEEDGTILDAVYESIVTTENEDSMRNSFDQINTVTVSSYQGDTIVREVKESICCLQIDDSLQNVSVQGNSEPLSLQNLSDQTITVPVSLDQDETIIVNDERKNVCYEKSNKEIHSILYRFNAETVSLEQGDTSVSQEEENIVNKKTDDGLQNLSEQTNIMPVYVDAVKDFVVSENTIDEKQITSYQDNNIIVSLKKDYKFLNTLEDECTLEHHSISKQNSFEKVNTTGVVIKQVCNEIDNECDQNVLHDNYDIGLTVKANESICDQLNSSIEFVNQNNLYLTSVEDEVRSQDTVTVIHTMCEDKNTGVTTSDNKDDAISIAEKIQESLEQIVHRPQYSSDQSKTVSSIANNDEINGTNQSDEVPNEYDHAMTVAPLVLGDKNIMFSKDEYSLESSGTEIKTLSEMAHDAINIVQQRSIILSPIKNYAVHENNCGKKRNGCASSISKEDGPTMFNSNISTNDNKRSRYDQNDDKVLTVFGQFITKELKVKSDGQYLAEMNDEGNLENTNRETIIDYDRPKNEMTTFKEDETIVIRDRRMLDENDIHSGCCERNVEVFSLGNINCSKVDNKGSTVNNETKHTDTVFKPDQLNDLSLIEKQTLFNSEKGEADGMETHKYKFCMDQTGIKKETVLGLRNTVTVITNKLNAIDNDIEESSVCEQTIEEVLTISNQSESEKCIEDIIDDKMYLDKTDDEKEAVFNQVNTVTVSLEQDSGNFVAAKDKCSLENTTKRNITVCAKLNTAKPTIKQVVDDMRFVCNDPNTEGFLKNVELSIVKDEEVICDHSNILIDTSKKDCTKSFYLKQNCCSNCDETVERSVCNSPNTVVATIEHNDSVFIAGNEESRLENALITVQYVNTTDTVDSKIGINDAIVTAIRDENNFKQYVNKTQTILPQGTTEAIILENKHPFLFSLKTKGSSGSTRDHEIGTAFNKPNTLTKQNHENFKSTEHEHNIELHINEKQTDHSNNSTVKNCDIELNKNDKKSITEVFRKYNDTNCLINTCNEIELEQTESRSHTICNQKYNIGASLEKDNTMFTNVKTCKSIKDSFEQTQLQCVQADIKAYCQETNYIKDSTKKPYSETQTINDQPSASITISGSNQNVNDNTKKCENNIEFYIDDHAVLCDQTIAQTSTFKKGENISTFFNKEDSLQTYANEIRNADANSIIKLASTENISSFTVTMDEKNRADKTDIETNLVCNRASTKSVPEYKDNDIIIGPAEGEILVKPLNEMKIVYEKSSIAAAIVDTSGDIVSDLKENTNNKIQNLSDQAFTKGNCEKIYSIKGNMDPYINEIQTETDEATTLTIIPKQDHDKETSKMYLESSKPAYIGNKIICESHSTLTGNIEQFKNNVTDEDNKILKEDECEQKSPFVQFFSEKNVEDIVATDIEIGIVCDQDSTEEVHGASGIECFTVLDDKLTLENTDVKAVHDEVYLIETTVKQYNLISPNVNDDENVSEIPYVYNHTGSEAVIQDNDATYSIVRDSKDSKDKMQNLEETVGQQEITKCVDLEADSFNKDCDCHTDSKLQTVYVQGSSVEVQKDTDDLSLVVADNKYGVETSDSEIQFVRKQPCNNSAIFEQNDSDVTTVPSGRSSESNIYLASNSVDTACDLPVTFTVPNKENENSDAMNYIGNLENTEIKPVTSYDQCSVIPVLIHPENLAAAKVRTDITKDFVDNIDGTNVIPESNIGELESRVNKYHTDHDEQKSVNITDIQENTLFYNEEVKGTTDNDMQMELYKVTIEAVNLSINDTILNEDDFSNAVNQSSKEITTVCNINFAEIGSLTCSDTEVTAESNESNKRQAETKKEKNSDHKGENEKKISLNISTVCVSELIGSEIPSLDKTSAEADDQHVLTVTAVSDNNLCEETVSDQVVLNELCLKTELNALDGDDSDSIEHTKSTRNIIYNDTITNGVAEYTGNKILSFLDDEGISEQTFSKRQTILNQQSTEMDSVTINEEYMICRDKELSLEHYITETNKDCSQCFSNSDNNERLKTKKNTTYNKENDKLTESRKTCEYACNEHSDFGLNKIKYMPPEFVDNSKAYLEDIFTDKKAPQDNCVVKVDKQEGIYSNTPVTGSIERSCVDVKENLDLMETNSDTMEDYDSFTFPESRKSNLDLNFTDERAVFDQTITEEVNLNQVNAKGFNNDNKLGQTIYEVTNVSGPISDGLWEENTDLINDDHALLENPLKGIQTNCSQAQVLGQEQIGTLILSHTNDSKFMELKLSQNQVVCTQSTTVEFVSERHNIDEEKEMIVEEIFSLETVNSEHPSDIIESITEDDILNDSISTEQKVSLEQSVIRDDELLESLIMKRKIDFKDQISHNQTLDDNLDSAKTEMIPVNNDKSENQGCANTLNLNKQNFIEVGKTNPVSEDNKCNVEKGQTTHLASHQPVNDKDEFSQIESMKLNTKQEPYIEQIDCLQDLTEQIQMTNNKEFESKTYRDVVYSKTFSSPLIETGLTMENLSCSKPNTVENITNLEEPTYKIINGAKPHSFQCLNNAGDTETNNGQLSGGLIDLDQDSPELIGIENEISLEGNLTGQPSTEILCVIKESKPIKTKADSNQFFIEDQTTKIYENSIMDDKRINTIALDGDSICVQIPTEEHSVKGSLQKNILSDCNYNFIHQLDKGNYPEKMEINVISEKSYVTATENNTEDSAIKPEFEKLTFSLEDLKLINDNKETLLEQSNTEEINYINSAEKDSLVVDKKEMHAMIHESIEINSNTVDKNKQRFPAIGVDLKLIGDSNFQADIISVIGKEDSQTLLDKSEHNDNSCEYFDISSRSLTIRNNIEKSGSCVEETTENYGNYLKGHLKSKGNIASTVESLIFSGSDYDKGLSNSTPMKNDRDDSILISCNTFEESKVIGSTSTSPEPNILSSIVLNKRHISTGNEPSLVKQLKQRFENSFSNIEGSDEQNLLQGENIGTLASQKTKTLGAFGQLNAISVIDEKDLQPNINHKQLFEGVNILENTRNEEVRHTLSLDSEVLNNNLLSVEQELSSVVSIENEELDRGIEKEIYDIDAIENSDAIFALKEGKAEGKSQIIDNKKLDVTTQQKSFEIDEIPLSESINPLNEFYFYNSISNKKRVVPVDPALLSFDPMDEEISTLEDEKIDEEILTEITKVDSIAYNETGIDDLFPTTKNYIKKIVLSSVDFESIENIEEEELDEEMQRVLEEVDDSSNSTTKNVLPDEVIETSQSAIGFFSDCNKLDRYSDSPCSSELIETFANYGQSNMAQDAHDNFFGYYNNDEAILEDTINKDEYAAGEFMVDTDGSTKYNTLLQHDMNNYEFFKSSISSCNAQFILGSSKDNCDEKNMSLAEPTLSSLQPETTGAGESFSESCQDLKDLHLSLSTESDSSDFHLWSSNVEFGEPSGVSTVQDGMDFDSIISAPNLDEALKKLERHIQDKGECFQWLSARTPSPSLQSLENCFKDGVPFFDTEEFYNQVSGGIITGDVLSTQDYSKNEVDDDIVKCDLWATPCENLPSCTYVQGSEETEGMETDNQEDQAQDWIISPYQYPRVIFSNTTQMSIIDEEDDSRKSEPTSPLQQETTQLNTVINKSIGLKSVSNGLADQVSLYKRNTDIRGNNSYKDIFPVEKLNSSSVSVIANLSQNCSIDQSKSQDTLDLTPEKNGLQDEKDELTKLVENASPLVEEEISLKSVSIEDISINSSFVLMNMDTQNDNDYTLEQSKEENFISTENELKINKNDQNRFATIHNKNKERDSICTTNFESPKNTSPCNFIYKKDTSSQSCTVSSDCSTKNEIEIYQNDTLKQPSINHPKDKKVREEIKYMLEYNIGCVTEEIINDFSVSERKLYWDTKLQKIKDVENQNSTAGNSGPKILSQIKLGTVSKLVSCFGQPIDDDTVSSITHQVFVYPKTISHQTNHNDITDQKLKENYMTSKEEHKSEASHKIESVDSGTNIQTTASMKLVSHWKTYWDDMINEQTENSQIKSQALHKIPSIQISEEDETVVPILQDDCISNDTCTNGIAKNNNLLSDLKETTNYIASGQYLSSLSHLETFDLHKSTKDLPKEVTVDENIPNEILSVPFMPRVRSYSSGNIDKEFLKKPNMPLKVEDICTDEELQKCQSEDNVQHQNEFRIRFERAKQFFRHLEQSGPSIIKGREYRSMPRLDLSNKIRKPSVDSDSGAEVKVQIKRDHSRGRRRRRKKDKGPCKIQSAPTSDTETSKRVNRQESSDSFGGSVKIRKVSERFQVKDLFRDVSDGDGFFKGIPNRAAVLASLRSVEDVRAASSNEIDHTDLKSSASLGNIPSGFQEEYPYLPTTPIHRFRPRSALGLNLIPRSELLDENF